MSEREQERPTHGVKMKGGCGCTEAWEYFFELRKEDNEST